MIEKCKKMCQTMSIEEKKECVTQMMPKCLDTLLDSLDKNISDEVAKDMREKINSLLEKYISNSVLT